MWRGGKAMEYSAEKGEFDMRNNSEMGFVSILFHWNTKHAAFIKTNPAKAAFCVEASWVQQVQGINKYSL